MSCSICSPRSAIRRPCLRERRGPSAARGLAAAAVVLVALTAGPAAPTAEPTAPVDRRLRSLAAAAGEREPLIRVGFDDGARVVVGSSAPYRIIDPATGRDVWRDRFRADVAVLPEGGPEGGARTVYRVQVGAFSSERAADDERAAIEAAFGVPAVVRYVPDRGSWRVRAGESPDRDGLSDLVERLRASGRTGLWIADEPVEQAVGVTLRLVDTTTYESVVVETTGIAVVPSGRGAIAIDGVDVRGVVEVRVTAFGTVRAINWVHLENYLRGVVPAELGPEVWPQLQALEAQAIAARTYAWGHMGQFDDDGFDQCATPRCQVYKGRAAEHPLSDRAVAATRGRILTWEGRPINAMFTATCGGHTEDAGEIFPEERAEYLRGVPCRAEGDALRSRRFEIAGRAMPEVRDRNGRDVTRDWALLVSAGVLSPAASEWIAPATAGTIDRWTAGVRGLAGTDPVSGAQGAPADLGGAVERLVRGLGWTERAEVLLSEADLDAVLRDPTTRDLPLDRRRALAYLVRLEVLSAGPDGSYGAHGSPDGVRLLPALATALETYDASGLREATVAEFKNGSLRTFRGKGESTSPLAAKPFLFALSGGTPTAVERLELWPGDRVRFRTDRDGRIDFLELRPPVKGVSDDRLAGVYSWEVRMTRRELERSIARRVDVGTLVDLRVVRRGVSGRIVELEVVGDRAREIVRGFDIRRLLGLRESLVVFEIQRDGAGAVRAVVFAGKGWGHGIGLCQVGAYGMALRGEDHRAILAHYYRGTRLESIPGLR